ncbi:TIGR00645 family protein [Gammaproteobacteria bacterium]|jgi:uncharacterized protein (TIGR00645 family)|nr:TIGR00645 family protein [Gammaproteobacteria bacterium]MDC3027021.1 TIGR00645 family protein [Gammaproteobacteria bacterium]GIS23268.1 MAG: UPF0114 protein [Gammaproteobacteria bacterium]|tara:strand:+ start:289 stop:816 length:528 start_codon:yes stop_codon:yes gene_type:complete
MRTIENLLEGLIYASRWLLAPIYMILCLCLALIAITTIQHFIQYAPGLMSMKLKEVLLFVLQVVDLALIANLVVMIIFSGYENFISKIDVAKDDRDRPDWMGSVDFSDLKIKLVASILAISGIGLLETFLKIAGSGDVAVSEVEIKWMVIIHIIFIISGLLLAMMDYVAHRSSKH